MNDFQRDNQRIAALPVFTEPTEDFAKECTQVYGLASPAPNPDGSPFCLTVDQAYALWSYAQFGGYMGQIGVGGGKSLTSFATADLGATLRGHQRMLLLIPPKLTAQTVKKAIPWIRQRMPMRYNVHVLAGKTKSQRAAAVELGSPGLYIMAYSQLSRLDSEEILRAISPTLLIADEAHRLSDPKSGMAKRFWAISRELIEGGANVEFCFLSGTAIKKGIKDIYLAMRYGLKENSPVPLIENNMGEWDSWIGLGSDSMAIDESMEWLCGWARQAFPDDAEEYPSNVVGLRRSFATRLRTAPGVIMSRGQSCSASIQMSAPIVPGYEQQQELAHLIQQAQKGTDPLGEPLATPMNGWNVANELTNGFFNYRYWPEPGHVAHLRGISEAEATDLIEKSKLWLKASMGYRSLCFEFTREAPLGFDTELQVRNLIRSGDDTDIDPELVAAYWRMQSMDFEGRVDRLKAYHWVTRWKIEWLAQQVKETQGKEGMLVWAYHKAMQGGLFEEIHRLGLDPIIAGGEYSMNLPYLEDVRFADRVFVVSQKSCEEGLELQHFGHELLGQAPRQGSVIEQIIGRVHRTGQARDEVTVTVPCATPFEEATLGACLLESAGLHSISGSQKAMVASWSPPPSLPPDEMLYLRVPGLQHASKEVRDEYLSRFVGN